MPQKPHQQHARAAFVARLFAVCPCPPVTGFFTALSCMAVDHMFRWSSPVRLVGVGRVGVVAAR